MPNSQDCAPGTSRRRQRGITLVELLVAMSIAFMLSGMMLLSWFALQDSYSQTTRAGEAREEVRDAVSRMVREIRDAQGPGGGPAITYATPWRIDFYTTFNAPGDEDAGFGELKLTSFQYDTSTGELVRYRDTDGNNVISTTLDRRTVLATHGANPSSRYLFRYWTYDALGYPYRSSGSTLIANSTPIRNIYSVEIRLVTDLNPGKSPDAVYVRSTAQLRNARPL